MPPIISSKPCHALSQSPVITPITTSIIPCIVCIIPSTIPCIASSTELIAFLIIASAAFIIADIVDIHNDITSLIYSQNTEIAPLIISKAVIITGSIVSQNDCIAVIIPLKNAFRYDANSVNFVLIKFLKSSHLKYKAVIIAITAVTAAITSPIGPVSTASAPDNPATAPLVPVIIPINVVIIGIMVDTRLIIDDIPVAILPNIISAGPIAATTNAILTMSRLELSDIPLNCDTTLIMPCTICNILGIKSSPILIASS